MPQGRGHLLRGLDQRVPGDLELDGIWRSLAGKGSTSSQPLRLPSGVLGNPSCTVCAGPVLRYPAGPGAAGPAAAGHWLLALLDVEMLGAHVCGQVSPQPVEFLLRLLLVQPSLLTAG